MGRGKGESEAPGGGGGVGFLLENPRRGGGLQEGEGPRGRAGRVSAANWGIGGGGGSKYFFRGRNAHQEKEYSKSSPLKSSKIF